MFFIRWPSSSIDCKHHAERTIEKERTDDHVQPPLFGQNRTILDDVPVRGPQDVELTPTNVVLQRTTLRRITLVADRPHRGGLGLWQERVQGRRLVFLPLLIVLCQAVNERFLESTLTHRRGQV